jgi:hypothetical protein
VPRCPDLLDRWTPTTLLAGDVRLVGDPAAGTAELHREEGSRARRPT